MNKKMKKYSDKVMKVGLSFLLLCGLIVMNTNQSQALDTTDYPKNEKVEYHGKISYGNSTVGNFTIGGVQAFCMEHPKTTPGSGTSLTSTIYDNDNIRKVMYYGYGGDGQWSGFDSKAHGIVATSLVLSHYYYGDSIGSDAKEFYDYVKNKTVPKFDITFSKSSVKSYVSGKVQRTETVTLNSEATLFTTSFGIQSQVTFVNETTGKRQTGGTVTIKGKDKFHFEAPLDVSLSSWSTGNKVSYCRFMPILSKTSSSSTQDLGYIQRVRDPSKTTSLSIDWLQYGDLEIVKKDDRGNYVPDVIFQVSDKADMSNVIGTYKTDSTGKVKTSQLLAGTYYVQEVSAPEHLVIDRTIHKITIAAGKTASFIQTNAWRKARIVINKVGEVLDDYQEGQFIYEEKALEGAVFDIYAKEDIIDSVTNEVVYQKDDYIQKLVTDESGQAYFETDLFGEYYVKETKACQGYIISEEVYSFVLTHNNQEDVSVVIQNQDIRNERQQYKIHIDKTDKDTQEKIEGVIFGLFSYRDIVNDKGNVIVEKGTLLETVITDENGQAYFTLDLPTDFSEEESLFIVKELKTRKEYQLLDTYQEMIDTHYTVQDEKEVVYDLNIVNEKIKTDIQVGKKDSESQEMITGKDFMFTMYKDKACTQVIESVKGDIKTGIATFKDITFGTYYIKETSAPLGYQLSDKVKEIVVNESLEGVGDVYQFDYMNEKEKTVSTGDNNHMMLYMSIIIAISYVGVCYFLLRKREVKREN